MSSPKSKYPNPNFVLGGRRFVKPAPQKAALALAREELLSERKKRVAAEIEFGLAKKEIVKERRKRIKIQKRLAFDDLTRLWSRAVAVEIINKAIAAARREGYRPVNFIVIDLDDFGKINKRWGDPVGDKVLFTAAQALKAIIRPTDAIIRHGGEEILVVAAGQYEHAGIILADRLREAVAKCRFELPKNVVLKDGWRLPAGSTVLSKVILPNGREIKAGTVLAKTRNLPVGSRFPDGLVFRVTASLGIAAVPLNECPVDIASFNPNDPGSFIGRVMAQAGEGLRLSKNEGKNRCHYGFPAP